ncbi:MAG: pentapeptide repeat-containing protein [Chryseobacterium sp.]|nr:MAG: pentapeptide repeat-containing protein [Chryseobacterium sp.]
MMQMRMYHEEQDFNKLSFVSAEVQGTEFNLCRFDNCDFSDCAFHETIFTDCEFSNCNFTSVDLADCALKNVRFADCKMLGLDFTGCRDFLFKANFDNCRLDYSVLSGKDLRKTSFKGCSLLQADFTDCNLSAAVFTSARLDGAVFVACNLEKADFRSALGYEIDPDKNRLKNARFSADGLGGLLTKYEIKID